MGGVPAGAPPKTPTKSRYRISGRIVPRSETQLEETGVGVAHTLGRFFIASLIFSSGYA